MQKEKIRWVGGGSCSVETIEVVGRGGSERKNFDGLGEVELSIVLVLWVGAYFYL